MDDNTRKRCSKLICILISIILICMIIPLISAEEPGVTSQITPFMTVADIVVTNGSFTNHTLPSGYQVTPTPLKVQVELPETALPAPKGEMAAGPRTIGFSIDPATLAVLIIAACAVGIGAWLVVKKKRDEEKEE